MTGTLRNSPRPPIPEGPAPNTTGPFHERPPASRQPPLLCWGLVKKQHCGSLCGERARGVRAALGLRQPGEGPGGRQELGPTLQPGRLLRPPLRPLLPLGTAVPVNGVLVTSFSSSQKIRRQMHR